MTSEHLPPRGFVFYCLAPFLVAFLFLMPLLARPPEPSGWCVIAICELLAALVLLGLFDADRFWWCWRSAGAIVFLAYVWYLIALLVTGELLGDGRRSSATALNALFGLIIFGLPGLWFALFGRLTLRPESGYELFGDDDFDEE